MAIPDNYIDHFNKDGDKRYISPAADKVRVDNENFEGSDLDQVLNEISESIGEAGQVNEIIMNGQPYTPTNKVIDLGTVITQHQDISGKVDKVTGKGLSTNDYTDAAAALVATIVNKANSTDVYTKSQTYSKSEVDAAVAAASSGAVSVTTNQDGTFTIHVGDTDYTINLNHTHQNMCKLEIVDEEPSNPATDTIYALVDDASDPTEIESLWIAGLEFFGGVPLPVIKNPANGSSISMGDTENGSVSKPINIKGKRLTQDLEVELDGTGYSFDTSDLETGVTYDSGTGVLTIDKDVANATDGVDIVVVYTGSTTNAGATMEITSSSPDSISCQVSLIANYRDYDAVTAVKFTGSQKLELPFSIGSDTSFELDFQFVSDNSLSKTTATFFYGLPEDNTKKFYINNRGNNITTLMVQTNSSSADLAMTDATFYNRGTLSYSNGSASHSNGGSCTPGTINYTKTSVLLGGKPDGTYDYLQLKVYRLKVYESNVKTHDFVPATKNNVAGLYDTIGNAFYSSTTGTDLVVVES